MRITWFGHSAFGLVTSPGTRIVTDPYVPSEKLVFSRIDTEADIVTVSHGHWDHAGVHEVKGSPQIINTIGKYSFKDVDIEGYGTYHDPQKGRLRGENIVFRICADGFSVLHMGDLGAIPDAELIGRLHGADILLIPVGGIYTIGPSEAKAIIALLQPRIVIPMHYAHPKCLFLSFTADDCVRCCDAPVVRFNNHTIETDDLHFGDEITFLILESAR
jgi:L-ascorbate metabolism protein UlaG (beta-lactamase superfamily)